MAEVEGFDAHLAARERQARAVVDATHDALNDDGAYYTPAEAQPIAKAVIDALADVFRAHAAEVTLAKRLGHKTVSRELSRVAEEVANVGVYVGKLEFDDEAREIAQAPDAPTGDHVAKDADGVFILNLDRREPGSALAELTNGLMASTGELTEVATSIVEDVKAYLSGDTDIMPEMINTAPDAEIMALMDATVVVDTLPSSGPAVTPPYTPETDPMTSNLHVGKTATDQVDFFASLGPPAYGGPRLSLADLRKPPAIQPEPGRHLSYSSVNQMEECPLRFRLTRREHGISELPAWANVGGNAFHRAIERLELAAHENGWDSTKVKQMISDLERETESAPGPWAYFLGSEIAKIEAESGVSQTLWRAAKQGSEGYTFWLVNGRDMVKRYIHTRDPKRRIFVLPDGRPAIELEFLIDVEGVPLKGFIDQVWYANDPTALIIDDLKSGASIPKDTSQLGAYAHALYYMIDSTGPGFSRILGRFFDARRGEYTATTTDLFELHPWDVLAYRVTTADQMDRLNLYPPRTSGLGGGPCGNCGVKRACPVGGKA
jgi:putative RecB family exonuclease